MPHIQELSPHIADLIAAGEVVERPASVVKELCENAVDAGAHTVTVEIQNGGMTLIRVTDDGCGIAPGECETAFLRHATSKIRTEYDLEAIGTLGFRGEALAAIAAVARVELLTRRQEDTLGTALTIEGGRVVEREEAGCPMGTTLLIRDLFFNTPARLKFMKKDSAEGAACLAAVHRQALGHPEVSFKFIRDGKQELLTPGDGELRSALYAVLGRELALGYIPAAGSGEDISVSGFVSLPTCCRGNRGYQFFFVNGRYVKSQSMTAALEQAYANQRMVGKFPGCVLHLTVKLNGVDVNVHPTKQEVKFGHERAVFSAVYYAVLSALGGDKSRPQAAQTLHPHVDEGRQTSLPMHDFTAQSKTAGTVLTVPAGQKNRPPVLEGEWAGLEPAMGSGIAATGAVVGRRANDVPPVTDKGTVGGVTATQDKRPAREEPAEEGWAGRCPAPTSALSSPVGHGIPDAPLPSSPKETPSAPEDRGTSFPQSGNDPVVIKDYLPGRIVPEAQNAPWHIVGELFHTYIVVEQGEKALLIDKHAAHERMNFDRMRARDYTPMSQILLTPVVFAPTPEEHSLLLEYAAELDRVGFEVEDFGGGALVVRRVPDYLEASQAPAALTEIAGRLALTGSTGEEARMDEIYHTMACKAAIKGGWKNAREELEVVARAVMDGEVKYCPHGRPVCVELTRTQLEKQLKRRV